MFDLRKKRFISESKISQQGCKWIQICVYRYADALLAKNKPEIKINIDGDGEGGTHEHGAL